MGIMVIICTCFGSKEVMLKKKVVCLFVCFFFFFVVLFFPPFLICYSFNGRRFLIIVYFKHRVS